MGEGQVKAKEKRGCQSKLIGASVLLLACSSLAYGQDWEIQPTISVSSTYETNPNLDANQSRSNTLYNLNPSVVGRLELPTSVVEADLATTLTRSRNQAIAPDTETFDFGASLEKVFNRTTVDLGSRVSLEEFANSDFDDAQALSSVDATAANEDDTIFTYGFDSGVSREFTSLLTGDVTFSFVSTEFSDDTRTDSEDYRVDNGWSYALNEVLSATANVSLQYFDPSDDEAETTLRLTGGADYVIDEEHSLGGNFGLVSNSNDTSFILDWSQFQSFRFFDVVSSSNFDLTADENGQLERTSSTEVTFVVPVSDLERISVGGGFAETGDSEVTEVNGSYEIELSDFISTSFALSARQTEDFDDATNTSTITDQLVFTPTLNWTISEEISALGRYDEIHQSEEGAGSANSRRATLTFFYNLPPI